MSIDIVRGASSKPAASQALDSLMSTQTELSGQLFIGYPIISTPEGRHPIDALLVTPDKGVVVFDLIEGIDTGDYGSRQDDSANKLEARLKTHRELMKGRDLRIGIHTISFAPGISNPSSQTQDNYPLVNSSSLLQKLRTFTWREPDKEVYKKTLSAIESISTIRKSGMKRTTTQETSRGSKLKRLEDSIATLDNMQIKAVIETVEGVQRIRGLAGSGKTIVLALKAAYLHVQHPKWRIGVTFNTRSLKGHFRRLIEKFTLEQTGEEPDWENLRIIHAWGSPGGGDRDGIYHQFCRAHDIPYFDFTAAKNKFASGREFAGACEHALGQAHENKSLYDVLLVDEAQDFSPTFLQLCYELLDDSKRLVYAYDELQSLSGESLPSPEEIFGKKSDGSSKVPFDNTRSDGPQRDIILAKCYRNSRPVLVTAHALGFGIYREVEGSSETGLIQMFDHPQLWEEIGYRSQDGELREGSPIVLYRPEETSPKFLENHSALDDLIQFILFDSEEEQTHWLTKAIKRNLEEDELRHDDIVVINPDPLTTRRSVGSIRRRLLEMDIQSHLAGVDYGPDTFFQPDTKSVTFTGIYRAKGNEAGMVYIINAQDCHSTARNLASIRNRLFTAITRSKAWIRVLGVGSSMEELQKEYAKLKGGDFELRFTYPTEEQREQLRVVHRDMTTAERNQLKSRQKSLDDLIKDIESGSVHIEDLDKGTVEKLRALFAENA
ncbi:MAG: ATP-binding domain-containing protein [Paracoccaceae bacterium]|nr:ATP-binding domain-containing protein [Paracoccaceae bacterium]